jgi:polysaccharide export outer membrane protein
MKPMGMGQVIWVLLVVLVAGLVAMPVPSRAQAQQVPKDYILAPGDVLDIAVFGQSDLTRTVTVRPDGKISLPLVGEVQATGLTPSQLAERLVGLFRTYLKEPMVTVTVSQVRVTETQVYIVGEVRSPGSYELRKGWTVIEAIAQAGGVTDKAALTKASVIRRTNNSETIPVDLDRLLRKGDQTANVQLVGGDVVMVPEFQNRVVVMGGVRNVGAFDLREGARVLDAIVAAGGPSEKAKLGEVGITRQQGEKRVLLATIDVNKIMRGQGDASQNIVMQHGDVVFVPEGRIRWQDLLSYLSGAALVRAVFGF